MTSCFKSLAGFSLIVPIMLLPSLVEADKAQAADCITKTCVDVYVHNGQLVIEAHKGSGPKAAPKGVKPKVPKPKPTYRHTYRPTYKPTYKPTVVKPKRIAPAKKYAKKAVRKVAPVVSLNDKLIKLIPTANIVYEPNKNAIVNIPVNYWCDLPAVFNTKVAILGEVVDVAMRASFIWSFGDGSFFATTSPGAPYPRQVITHTYRKAGTYVVVLVATWGGTWSNNGVARAITGQIRKVSVTAVGVANAPTRLTQ